MLGPTGSGTSRLVANPEPTRAIPGINRVNWVSVYLDGVIPGQPIPYTRRIQMPKAWTLLFLSFRPPGRTEWAWIKAMRGLLRAVAIIPLERARRSICFYRRII